MTKEQIQQQALYLGYGAPNTVYSNCFVDGAHFALSNTQSDAVEFAEWIGKTYTKSTHYFDIWYSVVDGIEYEHETTQLYELFLFERFAANIPIVGAVYIYNDNAYTKDELYELFKTERNG